MIRRHPSPTLFPYTTVRLDLASSTRGGQCSVQYRRGCSTTFYPEYLRFLSVARGSLSELDTQYQIAMRLEFAQESPEIVELINRIFAKLTALMNALNKPRGE